MSKTRTNTFGQPIGHALPEWSPRALPPASPMEGRYCRLERLDPDRHWQQLHDADLLDPEGRNWTYLGTDFIADPDEYRAYIEQMAQLQDPMFHAIVELATGEAVGVATFMRIDPGNGVIEVGNIRYSPRLQRKPAATEAMFLMMRRVFDELGYRRYEWKCDSLNAPSRAAALRLGFQYEGEFRQAIVYKERNRDTAWYSIIDTEWPVLRTAYETWLAPDNFDAGGQQKQDLKSLIDAARVRQA
ncbi:MAG: GNAT family N-acetyltransferase [Hyphomicrobiaceae bacterium]